MFATTLLALTLSTSSAIDTTQKFILDSQQLGVEVLVEENYNISDQGANEILEGIKRTRAVYDKPITLIMGDTGQNSGLCIGARDPLMVSAYMVDTYQWAVNPADSVIMLNDFSFTEKNFQYFDIGNEDAQYDGYFSHVDADVDHTIVHEISHSISWEWKISHNTDYLDDLFLEKFSKEEMWELQKVSIYSRTNLDELYAEIGAEAMGSSNPRPFITKAWDKLINP